MPSLSPTPLDYTSKDFAQVHARLRDLAISVFPDWTDHAQANFGNVLLEMFAHTADLLTFYQDAQAAEAFLPTLTRRLSLIRLGRLIGFELAGAAAASGTVRFTIPAIDANPRTIAEGTSLRAVGTGAPLRFRTTAAGVIPAGQLFVDVAAEQSEEVIESVTSSEVQNLTVELDRVPYLDGSLAVSSAGEGVFTEVDTFLGQDPNDQVFLVLVDDRDRARVRFGNGTTGRIPTGLITFEYRVGGGTQGNVAANTIRVIEGAVTDGFGTVPVSANNAAAFTGGVDRQTTEAGREQAARSLRSVTRSVTKDDFETNALAVPGVIRALMATRNEDAAIAENAGRLVVVAAGGQTTSGRTRPAAPSATLLTAVETMVETTRPHTLTFQVTAEAVTFLTANISTRIFLARGAVAATVALAIRDALDDLFAAVLADGTVNPDIDFGGNLLSAAGTVTGEIPWSNVFNAIRDVSGVRRVDEGPLGLLINGGRASLTLTARQFPLLGTVAVEDADTGTLL